MNRYIKTAIISLTVAALINAAVFGCIFSIYNSGKAMPLGDISSPLLTVYPIDTDAEPVDVVVDSIVNKYIGFDVVCDEVQYPSKLLLSLKSSENANQQLVTPIAPPASTPTPNPGGSTSDIPVYKPVTPTVPNVSISNVAGTIKGRTYQNGINIFQGNGNAISTDTSALQAAINQGSNKCSFIAIRLSDGPSIAYNVRDNYRCASAYKSLVSLYIYKMAEAGQLSLDETMTYTSADYYSGSGIIKSASFGTTYTLRQLADYSLRYSDNIAYVMLLRYIDKSSLMEFAKAIGCENYSQYQYNWPDITALDAALWWAEIYKYSNSGSYGSQLHDIFLNATHNIIKKALDNAHPVAHKSGSISQYYHDCGIVESEDPYILVILSYNPYNYSSENPSYVNPVIQEIDKLMNP